MILKRKMFSGQGWESLARFRIGRILSLYLVLTDTTQIPNVGFTGVVRKNTIISKIATIINF